MRFLPSPNRCLVPLLLVAAWLPVPGRAQSVDRDPSSRPGTTAPVDAASQVALDLRGALALARASGPLAKSVEARRQIGLGRAREAGQWLNPSLEWRRENLGSSLQPDIFATLYVPMDLSGRRFALRQVAQAGRTRVNAEALQEQYAAELEVARAWLRAAAAQRSYGILEGQALALREIARADAARLKEGLVSEAVGLRTALEADRARVALVAVTTEVGQARTQLARLLGLAEAALPPLASLDLPVLPAAPDSQQLLAVALRTRPDLQQREAAVVEAQRRLAAERRGVFGEVQLQGGTKQTSGVMTGQVGLAMPLPLFNRNGAARERAQGELAEARIQRDDLRLALAGFLTAARRGYDAVRRTAADAESFNSRGEEIARIARLAYREGHITLTELLDAERAAAEAMQTQLRWATEAWIARLDLERAIGARLDASGPLDLPLVSTLLTPGV